MNKYLKKMAGTLMIASVILTNTALAQQWDVNFIQQHLQERVDLQKAATGISVALISDAGVEYISYGSTTHEGSPVDELSVYEIGSITKIFTASILAEMITEGELNLDDSISQFLPSTINIPTRNNQSISLRNLSNQNSGLPRLPTNLSPEDLSNPYADYSVQQMYEFLNDYELTRDVGEVYEYSNLGVGLLGHVLAQKAGSGYEALVTEKILAPLAMSDTSITLSADQLDRLAFGHDFELNQVPNWDLPTLAGAGALRSTTSDMAKFIAANLDSGNSSMTNALQLTHENRTATTTPNIEIGLNWHISTDHGTEVIWHNGGTGGYRSFAGFVKDKNIGVVVLANSVSSVDDLGFYLLEPAYPLIDFRKELSPNEMNTDHYQQYTGLYQLAPNFSLHITIEGSSLFAQATGQPKFQIFQEAEHEFFLRVVDAQISFILDEVGNIGSLVLHQGGADMPAPRVDE